MYYFQRGVGKLFMTYRTLSFKIHKHALHGKRTLFWFVEARRQWATVEIWMADTSLSVTVDIQSHMYLVMIMKSTFACSPACPLENFLSRARIKIALHLPLKMIALIKIFQINMKVMSLPMNCGIFVSKDTTNGLPKILSILARE